MKSSEFAKMASVVILGLFLMSGGLAAAQSEVNQGLPWDGLIELSSGHVAAGIGFAWGEGKLTVAGKQHPLKVDGLSVGSVGISKASAWGKVYNLKHLTDISGTYTAVGTGMTVGGGASIMTMKNQNGVVIDLNTATQGVHFTLGTGGVTIKLEQ